MADLPVQIGRLRLPNPVLVASGCFGFGAEYGAVYDISRLGGVCTKALTVRPRQGNPPPRLWETASGLLNSIGLENPGVEAFLQDELPRLAETGVAVIANVWGATPDELAAVVARLAGSGVSAVELNLSCPNVRGHGVLGRDPAATEEVVRRARAVAGGLPLWAKLPPAEPEVLADVARAAKRAGADAVCAVNSFPAMAIDLQTGARAFVNGVAGLTGPAIKPLALRLVYELARAVDLPVIGIGGIATWEDAVEYLMAGAWAVQVGTANFVDPLSPLKIIDGMQRYAASRGLRTWEEIRGCAHR
jgi:dihydroorotate dehydrogenase (NAD+) catalytic subunit